MSEESLASRVRSAGYTPRARDVEALLELLGGADDDLERHALRALLRAGKPALDAAFARFDAARPPARARLCALVGRFASPAASSPDGGEGGGGADESVFSWLVARLSDDDPKTRRRAISALGRLEPGATEAPLLDALRQDRGLPDARALAFSLGNVGSAAARAALEGLDSSDAELRRLVLEALRKIDARRLRAGGGAVDLELRPLSKTPVLLHVRAGLEALLLDELADPSARMVGRGRVSTTLDGPLSTLFAARTFLHLGFPLPPEPVTQGDVASAVARSLTSAMAWDIMRALTRGPLRYRLEWGDRGRTRGQTARVAGAVQEARPELHNDSRDALWQVVVSERRGRVFLELWPRVQDPRFVYRRRTLPASSHPTIAAAIARAGGARPSDVVWDPFVGSGIELCERAHLGPFARLYGTDLSAEAIAAARENLGAAGITAARLEVADARHAHPPHGLSLVLTNPPFGRRVLERDAVGPLLSAVIEKSSRSLEKGGRLVWISPMKDETVAMAESHGFRVASRTMVDVGGLDGELQSFVFGEPNRRRRTT